MTDVSTVSRPEPAKKNLAARLIGVISSPGVTFRSIVAHPAWLGAMLVVVLTVAAANFALLSTEVGQQAQLDQQIRSSEAWGQRVSEEQQAKMEAMLPIVRYITAAAIIVVAPIVTFALAGLLLAVFNTALGGEATYKQVLAVNTHAGAITVIATLFTMPLNYARESLSGATNLAVFAPFLEESSLAARFLGMIDLFLVWWVVVLAIGLAVLYKRRTGPVALSLLGAYVGIAVIIAVVMRAFAGSQ
jgi:energy-converting hydrogenase Eha subunit H